ncbi:MAG: hypothetical protein HYW23_02165 [Candidatus Aenigmarchaeota archaeon]|nr:hypothetical protein [Candidatus Aenigmarchaeota archaeon]
MLDTSTGYTYFVEALNTDNFAALKSQFLKLSFEKVVPRGRRDYDQLDFLASVGKEIEDILAFTFMFKPDSFHAIRYTKSGYPIAYFRKADYVK